MCSKIQIIQWKKNQKDLDNFWNSNFDTFWQLATTPILQIW